MGLVLAFDTATSVATTALVRDGNVLGERAGRPAEFLARADELLGEAKVQPDELTGVAVGTGPGSFTGVRIGLAAARALGLSIPAPVAGVSTLEALAAGFRGAVPVIDAKRREVFALVGGTARCMRPEELTLDAGTTCVGDGAVRYRRILEGAGGTVPPDDDGAHIPWARLHALLAADFGPAEHVEPIYLRVPDAEQSARW